MIYKLRNLFTIFFLSSGLTACITPPSGIEPSVLGPQELELISTIKRGEDYASVGRLDLAEIELRRAMLNAPDLPIIYNDIGYSLAGQGRNREATEVYLKSLSLSPNDIVVENNLARNYYNLGEYEKALEVYGRITSYQTEADLLSKPQRHATLATYMPIVYHSMAAVNFLLGNLDEAKCYAKLVPTVEPTPYRILQYTRLLLSLNDTAGSAAAIYGLLVNNPNAITAALLVDYGISLYVNDDVGLADEAFSRALAKENIGYWDKQTASLFQLLIAEKRHNAEAAENAEDAESDEESSFETAKEDFFEEYSDFCETFRVDPDEYWPQVAIEEVGALVERLCNEEQ